MTHKLIVISESTENVEIIKNAVNSSGLTVEHKPDVPSAMGVLGGGEVVLLDVPNSLATLRELISLDIDIIPIVTGAKDTVQKAVTEGAYHCFALPLDTEEVSAVLKSAFFSLSMSQDLRRMRDSGIGRYMLGWSDAMMKLFTQVDRVAADQSPVFILGERGTGKETLAHALHKLSPRAEGPFVVFNATTEDTSHALFGTGKDEGRLMAAKGGTLYITGMHGADREVMEKLCAVINNGAIDVPGKGPVSIDVRLIGSGTSFSSKDPMKAFFKNFLKLPPLRKRPEDIVFLAEHFIKESDAFFKTGHKKLSKDAVKALISYTWPGNTSELKKTIRRACLLSKEVIEARHITMDDGSMYYSIKDFLEAKLSRFIKDMVKMEGAGLYSTVISEVEKALIELVLAETEGNQVKSAKVLGITRTTLRTKIKNYGLGNKG